MLNLIHFTLFCFNFFFSFGENVPSLEIISLSYSPHHRPAYIYSITIMQRPQDIDHDYQAKLLMKGPENCSTIPPPLGPPHPLEDNLFLSPALPASHL